MKWNDEFSNKNIKSTKTKIKMEMWSVVGNSDESLHNNLIKCNGRYNLRNLMAMWWSGGLIVACGHSHLLSKQQQQQQYLTEYCNRTSSV